MFSSVYCPRDEHDPKVADKDGYIRYKGETIHVTILKRFKNHYNIDNYHYIVKTDAGDILEMPPEAKQLVWSTKRDCETNGGYGTEWIA